MNCLLFNRYELCVKNRNKKEYGGTNTVLKKTKKAAANTFVTQPREVTERPNAPSGVAAFMSAHSKTPYITPSMDVSSGKGAGRGRRG